MKTHIYAPQENRDTKIFVKKFEPVYCQLVEGMNDDYLSWDQGQRDVGENRRRKKIALIG